MEYQKSKLSKFSDIHMAKRESIRINHQSEYQNSRRLQRQETGISEYPSIVGRGTENSKRAFECIEMLPLHCIIILEDRYRRIWQQSTLWELQNIRLSELEYQGIRLSYKFYGYYNIQKSKYHVSLNVFKGQKKDFI